MNEDKILCKGLMTKFDEQMLTVFHKYSILQNVVKIEIMSTFSVLVLNRESMSLDLISKIEYKDDF